MFHRFIIPAVVIGALGLGGGASAYSYAKVKQYKQQIVEIGQFCEATRLAPTFARIERVVDGDTLKLEGGEKIRMIGVDTTEICHFNTDGSPKEPDCQDEWYSQEAFAHIRETLEGQEVVLVGDPAVGDRDFFGRTLRHVYLRDRMIDYELVSEGWAPMYSRLSPRAKFYKDFKAAEANAKSKKLRYWGNIVK